MTGTPEYGTGRHEDYLSQQDERAEVARDHAAEQDHAEWLGWMDAQGYAASQRQGSEGYGGGDMSDAFRAGMQAARDLDAAQERPAPGVTVERLAAALQDREILVTGVRSAPGDSMWRAVPARPGDFAVQLLSAIDASLTDGPEAGG